MLIMCSPMGPGPGSGPLSSYSRFTVGEQFSVYRIITLLSERPSLAAYVPPLSHPFHCGLMLFVRHGINTFCSEQAIIR